MTQPHPLLHSLQRYIPDHTSLGHTLFGTTSHSATPSSTSPSVTFQIRSHHSRTYLTQPCPLPLQCNFPDHTSLRPHPLPLPLPVTFQTTPHSGHTLSLFPVTFQTTLYSATPSIPSSSSPSVSQPLTFQTMTGP